MRYFKTTSGQILCTFIRYQGERRHEIIHRCKNPFPEFPEYDPGIALYPSPEIPSERRYGPLIEISEEEALEADPGLFEKGFQDYEEYKRWEAEQMPAPATARKRKARESAVQEILF